MKGILGYTLTPTSSQQKRARARDLKNERESKRQFKEHTWEAAAQ